MAKFSNYSGACTCGYCNSRIEINHDESMVILFSESGVPHFRPFSAKDLTVYGDVVLIKDGFDGDDSVPIVSCAVDLDTAADLIVALYEAKMKDR